MRREYQGTILRKRIFKVTSLNTSKIVKRYGFLNCNRPKSASENYFHVDKYSERRYDIHDTDYFSSILMEA